MTRRSAAALCLVGVWMLCAHQRVRVWHDNASLWSDTLPKAGPSPRPAINFGRAAEEFGDDDLALRWSTIGRRRAERPTLVSQERYRQWHAIACTNEARLRARAGDFRAAEDLTRIAIRESPASLPARMTYALVMYATGRCAAPVNGAVRCPQPDMQ